MGGLRYTDVMQIKHLLLSLWIFSVLPARFPFQKMRGVLWVLLCLTLSGGVHAEPELGQARDFTLKDSNGVTVSLAQMKGQVVLLNFWASWCGPCREELPALNALHKQFKGQAFSVLGVNIDKNTASAIRLLQHIPVQFPILMDTQNEVAQLYEVKTIPTTFIIDRAGRLRFMHLGFRQGGELLYEKEVAQLLSE